MNNINSFTFGVNPVRTILIDGDPWFIASDLLRVLDLTRTSLRDFEDDEKGVHTVHTLGGDQLATVLSESGMYRLILLSRKKEAKTFKRWITHEVLPSIRKTGGYNVQDLVPKTLPEALRAYAVALEEKEALSLKVKEDAPKVEFHARVAESIDGQSIGEAAKVLGTGQNRLFSWLRSHQILMANNLPYQGHIDAGRFRVIYQTPWKDSGGQEHIPAKTLVTGKGLIWLQKAWDEDHSMDMV